MEYEDLSDYYLDMSNLVDITLNGESISVNSNKVAVTGIVATITYGGTYRITGTLTDGQIIVETNDEEKVTLILNGVDISCSYSAPISVMDSERAVILLAEDTVNYVSDASEYVFEADMDEPDACIFSKTDLVIYGDGVLYVDANYNDGIMSKDGLIIANGIITVDSVDDGIRGKDYIIIKDCDLTLNVEGDGLKSDNDEDTTKGFIAIDQGSIDITSGGDAIQAETKVTILDGCFTLTTGGGSRKRLDEDLSAKGIKADVSVEISGGEFTIDAGDDAIHSNQDMIIAGGVFDIATGDDGFHADSYLQIDYGVIVISDSYEGIESAVITINDGEISIISSDDGINVASGNDGSGIRPRPGGRDFFSYSSNNYFYMNGGYVFVDALGDGIDINGGVVMTGGTLIINGPTSNRNGALDYDGGFKMTGGYLIAVGSSGMAQAPDSSSTQYSILVNMRTSVQAGTIIHLETSSGEEIFSFTPTKWCQSIVFSSSELEKGTSYVLYLEGSSTGESINGLITDGEYTPGSKYTSFTITSTITRNG